MEFRNTVEQGYIPLPLPIIPGSSEYTEHEKLLSRIDQILIDSGIEKIFRNYVVKLTELQEEKKLSEQRLESVKRYASFGLRCNIARSLSKDSFRIFSRHLSESHLLRWFCGYDNPDAPRKMPGKTTLQRYSEIYDIKIVMKMIVDLLEESGEGGCLTGEAGLKDAIDTKIWLYDSTCIQLDIHHPVDWVLLRDAVKSIIRSIVQIRKHGLKHRVDAPESFVTQINKLSMEMTHARYAKDSKKKRKKIFRRMKKIAKSVSKHGLRYRTMLAEKWQETKLSNKQTNQILRKLDNILNQLPQAINVAHERIIGERKVKTDNKILSLYEPCTYVYTRKKAGAETEFGMQLLLGETTEGLIVDWELFDCKPANDTSHIRNIIERSRKFPPCLQPEIIVGDRGFHSKKNEKLLVDEGIQSMLCPKNPKELKQRLGDEDFSEMMKRRAQTEGRIGILKNDFIGKEITAKGFENQELSIAWSILSHNLWVLARLPWKSKQKKTTA